jgi:ribose 1,5-bisphosphokinase PhnN
MKHRGRFVTVVGPDGCGKSTLAASLAERLGATHLYWRPGLLPMAREVLGRPAESGVNAQPHDRVPDSSPKAIARSLYYGLDFVVGGWLKIRRLTIAGHDVVLERGVLDMLVDPARHGLTGTRILGVASRLAPRCDVLAIIDAPAETIRQRKPELPIEEIERQYRAWSGMDHGFRHKVRIDNAGAFVDAESSLVSAVPGGATVGSTGG